MVSHAVSMYDKPKLHVLYLTLFPLDLPFIQAMYLVPAWFCYITVNFQMWSFQMF